MVLFLRSSSRLFRLHIVGIAAALFIASLFFSVVLLPETSLGSYRPAMEYAPLFGDDDSTKDGDAKTKIQPQQQTSGRSRLGGRGSGGVSSGARRDTGEARVIPEDSTWVVYLDSTARLTYWKHRRIDQPYVTLFPDRTYPLFAKPSQTQRRHEVTPDSTISLLRFREQISGADTKIPLSVPLNEYVTARRKHEMRKLLADEARKPKQLVMKRDIGDVLSSFTKISIPVPSNPIFSIFGKPEINLQISGGVDIRAGFRNTTSDQTTANRFDQTRNEPDFNQEVQVSVNGTIGDKLNILADWNTQRTFEYENQLKIKYTGYDDEIVQSVEAGNVSLQTPSSFIGSSAALFGIKAKFQTGPLTLTTIASQKKGQIKEVEAKGGAQERPFEIQPWDYATNNFWVDISYKKYYEPYYQADRPTITPENQQDQIIEEEVWASINGTDPVQGATITNGIAFITLPPRPAAGYDSTLRSRITIPGEIAGERFKRLIRGQDYELTGDGYLGVISLNNVSNEQVIGIAYRTVSGKQYGEFAVQGDTTRIILKMVKPANLVTVGPTYSIAWQQMLKNIYRVGDRNLQEAGFSLDIYRRTPGVEDQNSLFGEPLLRVLGVDTYTANGTATPDNVFDFRVGRTINKERAEIIFPSIEPFDSALVKYFNDIQKPIPASDSTVAFREIYDTTKTFAQQSIRNRYVIKGKATGETNSKYQLGFNVVEGSVRVYENGVQLTPNVDYTVDYIVGEVIIRKPSALVPGANLQIKFEQNDLFQLASKTLLGARGDLFISPVTSLGFTVMNLNQQSLSDKVRLGEEPNTNTIFGIDGATSIKLPFLTSAIDALPVVATREGSELKLTGEAAYVLPDPNTRKSPIPSDGGAGIAYIDDFEGARRTIPLGTNYSGWTPASPPFGSLADTLFGVHDTTKMKFKAKSIWYNVFNTVRQTEVYPDKQVGNAANNVLTVMDLWYFPTTRGMYNYGRGSIADSLRRKNWGGIMKPISISGTNLINENVNFIEVWMEVFRNGSNGSVPPGKMYVDLGAISEDAIPNGRLNTEDLVPPSSTINNTLQTYEDVGLDMMTNAQEQALYPDLGGDPSSDDYAYDNNNPSVPFAYTTINGTENNRNSVNGLYPDTEDLNSSGSVNTNNSYFRYEMSLDTVPTRNPRIVGGGIVKGGVKSFFYQFRIPIREWTQRVGAPTFENVEYIRLSFENAQDTVGIRIADFSLVGNQWQELRKEDTTFAVSVIGVEENSNFYVSPPGVIRERDKTRPDEQVFGNEQSLALILKGLPNGQSRQAVKYFSTRPLDLFNYKTMKMFVHGDESFNFSDVNNYEAEFFFRFGADSLNYYEYRSPMRPAKPILPGDGPETRAAKLWDAANEVLIRFQDLTAIKQGRDSLTQLVRLAVPGGPPGSEYRVLGNPSLTQVRYMAVGVENPAGKGITDSLRGQVWVNELRVIEVDDSPGWAYRFDANLKLADLGAVSFNYSKVDPNFHSIDQRFGSRQTGTNWGINANMEFGRFFPAEWAGTSIPLSYSHTENLSRPKYLPNSDVLVGEAAERERARLLAKGFSSEAANLAADELVRATETYRVSDTWALPTFRIGLPSDDWWIRDTWNKLTFGFNYTRSTERSPSTVRRLSWQWSAKIQYQLTLNPEYYFEPFKNIFEGLWFLDEYKDLKIWYAPQSFNWSFNVDRTRDVSLQRSVAGQPPPQELISRNFSANRAFGFGWKLTENGLLNPSGDYSLNIRSSLLDLETDPVTKAQRRFSSIMDDIFFNNALINFGQDLNYSQRNSFNTRPNIPNIFNIKKYLDLSFGYNVDYNWQNSPTQGDLGKSVGFNNNITFSTNLKLKSLFDPLFEDSPAGIANTDRNTGKFGRRSREEGEVPVTDSTTVATPDSTAPSGPSGLTKTLDQLKQLSKIFIKLPFLDYENINISFSQTNTAGNSGVVGRPGFVNFWGRVPFFQDADPKYGPSRMYQLGLISDPHGRLTNFGARSKFPFFGWDVEPGIRAPLGVLKNTYRQTNRLSFKTTRALWEGARLDLNWNVGWTYNSDESFNTDAQGRMLRGTSGHVVSTSGSVDRSFLTLPNFLFLSAFKSDLNEVAKKYQEFRANKADSADDEKLARAFEQGFESLPFFRKIFGQFAPRVNWSLRWDGLERLPLFAGFVTRLSLDHTYTSNYTRSYENRQGSGREKTTGQRLTYGFAPLFGLNFTFKELLKGSMGANVRYNTNTTYDLATSSKNLVETLAQEISVTASYSRRGFEIPFFGLALNNDLELNASYSLTKNSRKQFEIVKLQPGAEGTPLDGSTRTTLEPRIKYVLSQRVNASVYYRHTKITPDAQGSNIPGSTTNEAGLDIHISIQ